MFYAHGTVKICTLMLSPDGGCSEFLIGHGCRKVVSKLGDNLICQRFHDVMEANIVNSSYLLITC